MRGCAEYAMYFDMREETIFAAITSPIRAGVIVIRISGSKINKCLEALAVKKIFLPGKTSFCKIYSNGRVLDECLITFFAAPNSFTGEDVVEISIHASHFILKEVYKILLRLEGVRSAEAGEFSKRAFFNGKIDLVQAEAIPDLIASETEAQHKQAMQQMSGALGKIYENWRQEIIEISSLIEAAIDFPEDDLPFEIVNLANSKVESLIAQILDHINDNNIGHKIKTGLSLAIIGAPNVGKSSLINLLAKNDISIVSQIAGTTRDVIETQIVIAGVPITICDTAGIRKTQDSIEKEGIRRALQKADLADIKLFIIDASNPVIDQSLLDQDTIIIVNKIDLLPGKINKINLPEDAIKLSIKAKTNLEALFLKLEEKVNQIIPNNHPPLITQERYRVALINCVKHLEEFSLDNHIELAAEELRLAATQVGLIAGRVDIENILDTIFSKFCIGK